MLKKRRQSESSSAGSASKGNQIFEKKKLRAPELRKQIKGEKPFNEDLGKLVKQKMQIRGKVEQKEDNY